MRNKAKKHQQRKPAQAPQVERTEPQTIEGTAHRIERPTTAAASLPARLMQENRTNSSNIIVALTGAVKALQGKGENPLQQVEFMERMLALQTSVENRQAEREFGAGKHALAMELPTIPKRHKIEFVDKNNVKQEREYADRVDIESVLDPLCRKHGFSKEYSAETDARGWSCQVLTVRHAGGHKEVYKSPFMPLDTSGAKNNNQGAGSTAEYGKRYAVVGAFNILGVDWDDDGAGGKGGGSTTVGDKFNDRVKSDAAKTPAPEQPKAETPPAGGKLTLAQAAVALEEKLVAATQDKRGAILMGHINIIEAMQADEKFAAKAAELRKMASAAPAPKGEANAAA
jgi:hypothetical protein